MQEQRANLNTFQLEPVDAAVAACIQPALELEPVLGLAPVPVLVLAMLVSEHVLRVCIDR